MKVISRKSELEINGTKMLVENVIASLKDLPSGVTVEFFNERQMNMPRKVRMSALHMVLDRRVKKAEFKATLTDEMNYRLKWLNTFSEHQLEGVLNLITNAEIYNEYREDLWLTFLKLHEELKIDNDALSNIYEVSRGYKMLPKESVTEYQRGMDILFYDDKNEVDGLEYSTFREVLLASSTLNELREIGAKFNIDVPRRIKKNELADIIIDEMSSTGQLSQDDQESIKRMSVMALQRYAKNNNIKASIELKKEDIIEYIISRVETEIQKSYVNLAILDIPTEDDPVEEEVVEEVAPVQEAVVEETKSDSALKSELNDLKAQINMLVQMQQKQIIGANDKKNDEELRRLEEEKAQAAEQARLAEEARIAAEARIEEEKGKAAEEARIAAEARIEEEKAKAAEQARLEAEAELAAEKARIEEEKAQAAEQARLEAETAKQNEIASIREENEVLKQEMTGMRESNNLEGDEFVIPVFDYEEAETPVEPVAAPVEEPIFDEAIEDPTLGEENLEDDGILKMEDISGEESANMDDMMISLDMDDMDNVGAMPDLSDFKEENFATVDTPTVTKIEEKQPAAESVAEDRFEAPTYEDGEESYGDFDTPLFDTPIFEAPVFEAPIYGEDREARTRRLSNESRADKKRKAAEERAIQEALRADSKVAKRKKKSNLAVRILIWLIAIIVILTILTILVGILGVTGVFKAGTPLHEFYLTIKDGIADIGNNIGIPIEKWFQTIKGWFGK